MKKRLLTTLLLTAAAAVGTHAQLGLTVSVHLDEAGTLYQKIQAEIEEIGELDDITSLTVSGRLNRDDQIVLRDQMKNLLAIDFSGIEADCAQFMQVQNRKRLKSIVLPTAATELTTSTLYGCDSLVTIVMPPGLLAVPNSFADGCRRLPIDIPQSVTEIGSRAFYNCDSLTAVTIPAGVTEIKNAAFCHCKALSSITFMSPSVVLRTDAFYNTGFETFTLPAGVVIDGDEVFGGCQRLTSFTFPDGLVDETQVGTSTFQDSKVLTQVRLPADLTVIPDNFFRGTGMARISLPPNIQRIGSKAFQNSQLEEFNWPATVTTIPGEAFRSCEKLTRIGIPATVDSIASWAFVYCYSLNHVRLPEGIRTIPSSCFSECTSLDDINIPSTVTYIGSSAFSRCNFAHVDIPDNVTFIGGAAFERVPLEGELKLPSKLRRLERGAFSGGKYTRVVVPEGCLSIGERPFLSDSLKVVDVPASVLSMGGVLLGDNSRFHPDSVIIRAMVPPYTKSILFFERENDFTLYVPRASVSLYQANSYINVGQKIEGIDVSSPVLTVTEETVIDTSSGLQQGKYDVNLFTTWGNSQILENYSDHHPRLRIAEGASLHAGTLSMGHVVADQWWFTQYKFDTFINQGTATADRIDIRSLMRNTHYFTPPYDVRMTDIMPEWPNTPFAFYRYDGAARAAGNFDKTWVRIGSDETLHAGQGYAFRGAQTPMPGADGKWTRDWTALHLTSHDGGTNYFLTADDVTLPLQHYAGEFAHNRNWNFVGQPYPAYLDIRGLDYDGPVLVNSTSSGSGATWQAYSALDDEFVLDPMVGIFIQAPDGLNSITFDAARRQHGKTFVKGADSNNARALRRADQRRQRVRYDATLLRQTGQGDTVLARTRFVINPAATTGYDIGRDAPLMSDAAADEPATLLYTQAGGVAYAINERPLADGIIRLGLQLAEPGPHTIALTTVVGDSVADTPNTPVWLIDNETGTRTLLTDGPYTFTAPAGSHPQRFTIALGDAEPTAISPADIAQPMSSAAFFDLQGRRVSQPQRGVYIHDGKIIVK